MNYKKAIVIFILIFVIISSIGSSTRFNTTVYSEIINEGMIPVNVKGVEYGKEDYKEIELIPITEEQENNTKEAIEEQDTQIIEFKINGMQLKEGIASDEVLRIKRFLMIKGYTLEEGYYFDSNTKSEVIKYQKENGLNPDGIIGPKTFGVINEDMKTNSINIPCIEIELPEIVPNGKWILIHKGSNTLYHYDHRELINRYPIATGKSPGHTPEGKFTIITKFINPYWGGAGRYQPIKGGAPNNPLGKRWLGLSIGGGGTYGIHGNADSYSIGKFTTLGCIRMFNEDIELLFDIIDYHTPVWIFANIPELIEEIEEVKIQQVKEFKEEEIKLPY